MKKINGARDPEVEEPLSGAKSILFEFEVDDVAEPKGLLHDDLRKLVSRHGSPSKVAIEIGASEAFVRQKTKCFRRRLLRKRCRDRDEEK